MTLAVLCRAAALVWLTGPLGNASSAAADQTLVHGDVRLFNRTHRFERRGAVPGDVARCAESFVGDFDGDRKAELLFVRRDGTITMVSISDPGARLSIDIREVEASALKANPYFGKWFAGNFDGDSESELASINANTGQWELLDITRSGSARLTPTACKASSLDRAVFAGAWEGNDRDLIAAYSQPGSIDYFPLDQPGCPRRRKFLAFWPTEPPRGRADFEGTGIDVLYSPDATGRKWFAHWFADSRVFDPLAPWADLSELVRNDRELGPEWSTGDFTGDGKDDLVVFTGSVVHGWWIAASQGWTGMELSTAGLPKPEDRPIRVVQASGDLNGDGLDELFIEQSTCELEIYEPVFGEPLAAAEVVAGERQTTTGPDGRFIIEGDASDVQVSHPRYEIQRAPMKRGGAENNIIRFTAFDTKAEEKGHSNLSASGREFPPYACTGYVPGARSKWGRVAHECPDGYAVMELDEPELPSEDSRVAVATTCCRLPDGILSITDHLIARSQCPDGYLVTGSPIIRRGENSNETDLRCTRVQEPYRLGPPLEGSYWGAGLSMRYANDDVDQGEVNPALRTAVGRTSVFGRDIDGCIPRVAGAVLSGVKNRGCGGTVFHTIVRKGENGAEDTPVPLLPPCSGIKDPIDPAAGCSSEDGVTKPDGDAQ